MRIDFKKSGRNLIRKMRLLQINLRLKWEKNFFSDLARKKIFFLLRKARYTLPHGAVPRTFLERLRRRVLRSLYQMLFYRKSYQMFAYAKIFLRKFKHLTFAFHKNSNLQTSGNGKKCHSHQLWHKLL